MFVAEWEIECWWGKCVGGGYDLEIMVPEQYVVYNLYENEMNEHWYYQYKAWKSSMIMEASVSRIEGYIENFACNMFKSGSHFNRSTSIQWESNIRDFYPLHLNS